MPRGNITTPEDLERYRQRKRRENQLYYGKTAHIYPRHAWKEEEIEMVMSHTMPDSALSDKIGRSVKSIQEKRRKIRREEEAKAAEERLVNSE